MRNGHPGRIGMVAPFPFPSDRGTPIRAKNLADIAATEFRVDVCSYHVGESVDADWAIRRIPDIPVEVTEAGASWKKAVCDGFLLWEVTRFLFRADIDIIHAHLHEGCLVSQLGEALSSTETPVIYDAHGTLVREMIETGFLDEDSLQRPVWEFLEDRIQRSADRVLAQSHPRKAALVDAGVPADRITVLPDFVDTELFAPREPNPGVAAQLDVPIDAPIVAYTGTLQDYQGIPEILNAFAGIHEEFPRAHLLLVGGGEISRYEETAADLGIAEKTRFTGRQPFEEMPSYLSLADVAVSPRRYGKNLPSKLLTYMSAGVPTISSDIEGVTGLIEHGDNGLLIPVKDSPALAEELETVLSDEDLRAILGESARATVLETYSKRACAETLLDVYEDMLQNAV